MRLPQKYRGKKVYVDTALWVAYVGRGVNDELQQVLKNELTPGSRRDIVDLFEQKWFKMAQEDNIKFAIPVTVVGETISKLIALSETAERRIKNNKRGAGRRLKESLPWTRNSIQQEFVYSLINRVFSNGARRFEIVEWGGPEKTTGINFELFTEVLHILKCGSLRSNYADRIILATSAADSEAIGLITTDKKLEGDISIDERVEREINGKRNEHGIPFEFVVGETLEDVIRRFS